MKNQAYPNLVPLRLERELDDLRELSARVGNDPLLVQASNGNTSIKLEGILWIKGSGKWLARANQEDILIPVDMAEAREAVEQTGEIGERRDSRNGMRPSIETAMHAVIPHRVVIHVHSINTIAWAIRLDALEELAARLCGLAWQWIPYAPSGIPLAWQIKMAMARAEDTNVFVLANHGLVVCGEDCAAAEDLLCDVERRLAIQPRAIARPDRVVLENIARFSDWEYPEFRSSARARHRQSSAQNSKRRSAVSVPGHFPGRDAHPTADDCRRPDWQARLAGGGRTPAFVVVERSGVILNENMTSAERANLIGLVEVMRRTKGSARLRYLTSEEVEKVLNGGGRGYKDEVESEQGKKSATTAAEMFDEAEYDRNACFS